MQAFSSSRAARRKFHLLPTATDIAAILLGADLFWFLADSSSGVVIALAVMISVMVISRFVRLLGESRRYAFRFIWLATVGAVFLLLPVIVGEVSRTHGFVLAGLLSLSVLGSDLIASQTDRVRIGSSAYIGIGVCAAAFALHRYSGDVTLVMATGSAMAVSAVAGAPLKRFGYRYLSGITVVLGVAVPLVAASTFMGWLPELSVAAHPHQLTGPDWLFGGPGTVVLLGLAIALALAFHVRTASQRSAVSGTNLSGDDPQANGSGRDWRTLGGYVVAAANGGLGGGLLVLIDGRIATLDGLVMLVAMEITINLVLTRRASLLGSLIVGLFTLLLLGQATDSLALSESLSVPDLIVVLASVCVGLALFQAAFGAHRTPTILLRNGARYSRTWISSMMQRAS